MRERKTVQSLQARKRLVRSLLGRAASLRYQRSENEVQSASEEIMKKKGIIVLLVAVLSVAIFGQGRNVPTPKEPKGPPTFVEEAIPDGKAVIYIYTPYIEGLVAPPSATILIFSKSGPLSLLPRQSYFSFVTDPGTVELWVIAGAGGIVWARVWLQRRL